MFFLLLGLFRCTDTVYFYTLTEHDKVNAIVFIHKAHSPLNNPFLKKDNRLIPIIGSRLSECESYILIRDIEGVHGPLPFSPEEYHLHMTGYELDFGNYSLLVSGITMEMCEVEFKIGNIDSSCCFAFKTNGLWINDYIYNVYKSSYEYDPILENNKQHALEREVYSLKGEIEDLTTDFRNKL